MFLSVSITCLQKAFVNTFLFISADTVSYVLEYADLLCGRIRLYEDIGT